MTILQSIILGAVQGITEFLPVSSSGHLQLAKELLGVHLTDNLTFDVALHAGTVCSTILVLRKEIWHILRGLFVAKYGESVAYILKIIISMIPVALVGFTLKDQLDEMLNSSYAILVVGLSLLVTAALLLFAHRVPMNRLGRNIGYKDAFLIGLAQAAAVLPGLSRSGSTIASGIILGCDRSRVAQFSFLMVLVPILGNTLLDLIKGGGELQVSGVSTEVLAWGFCSAFAVGALACRAMIELVRRGKLIFFAIYCAIVGALSILSFVF